MFESLEKICNLHPFLFLEHKQNGNHCCFEAHRASMRALMLLYLYNQKKGNLEEDSLERKTENLKMANILTDYSNPLEWKIARNLLPRVPKNHKCNF